MKRLLEIFQILYEERSFIKLFLYFTTILLGLLLTIWFTYYLATYIVFILERKFEALVIIIGAYLFINLWLKDKQKKQLIETNYLTYKQQYAENAIQENNYIIIRQCLYTILSENADILNLVKPEKLSDLDSPSRAILKGNVYMCQYLVLNKGDINTGKIKEMLQIRIDQKLAAHEFAGIAQTQYIYYGAAYPILCVDEVHDNGSYVQIDIVWASENYCSLLNVRAHTKMQYMQPQNINYRDSDF